MHHLILCHKEGKPAQKIMHLCLKNDREVKENVSSMNLEYYSMQDSVTLRTANDTQGAVLTLDGV